MAFGNLALRKSEPSCENKSLSGEEDDVGESNEAENRDKMHKPKAVSDINDVALRRYELLKLKYYFAIAECDSEKTANFSLVVFKTKSALLTVSSSILRSAMFISSLLYLCKALRISLSFASVLNSMNRIRVGVR